MKRKARCILGLFLVAAIQICSVNISIPVKADMVENEEEYSFNGNSNITISDEICTEYTGEHQWIKYEPKEDGYLKLSMANASALYKSTYVDGYLQLYDSSRKALTSSKYYSTKYKKAYYRSVCYGMNKDETYYIKLDTRGGTKITATYTKIKDTGGAEKEKAKTFKKKKTVTDYICAGSKKAKYYKVKLSKAKKISCSFTGYMDGPVKVTIMKAGMRDVSRTFHTEYSSNYGYKYNWTVKKKVKAGIYYICVEPQRKTTAGYFKLKMN